MTKQIILFLAVALVCSCRKDDDYSRKNVLEITYIVEAPKDTLAVYTPQKAMFQLNPRNGDLSWRDGSGLNYQSQVIKTGVSSYKILF